MPAEELRDAVDEMRGQPEHVSVSTDRIRLMTLVLPVRRRTPGAVRPIADLPRDEPHPLLGRLPDVRRVVQRARHRRDAEPGHVGDRLQRRALVAAHRRRLAVRSCRSDPWLAILGVAARESQISASRRRLQSETLQSSCRDRQAPRRPRALHAEPDRGSIAEPSQLTVVLSTDYASYVRSTQRFVLHSRNSDRRAHAAIIRAIAF